MEKDFYKLLNLTEEDKSLGEKDFNKKLKQNYKKLAKQNHPDVFQNASDEEKENAEENFKKIAEAYNVLSDKEKRRQYDIFGTVGKSSADSFNNMRNPFYHNHLVKGKTLVIGLNVSLEDLFNGNKQTLHYSRQVPCGDCGGHGVGNDGHIEKCSHCDGRGIIYRQQQMGHSFIQFQETCPYCRGYGETIINPCKTCNGSGLISRNEEQEIKLPKGIEGGMQFGIQGMGNAPYQNKGIFGDLIVQINEIPHSRFLRKGSELKMFLPVSFINAILGCEIEIETIDNKKIKFVIPPKSNDGKIFRLQGLGMPMIDNPQERGSLQIIIQHTYPNDLTDRQSELLKEFQYIEENKEKK